MMIASPTAASAAATAITKNTRICPSIPCARENATSEMFTAFSINSMDMNTMIALRWSKTPITPMLNRIALTMRATVPGVPRTLSAAP